MVIRAAKVLLLLAVALFYSVVVLNNTTDYPSNYAFVQHILSMDTTFPGNGGMWRAIRNPRVHHLFYLSIIAWQALTALLCWWGGWMLVRRLRAPAQVFNVAKRVGLVGLTLGLLLWFVAFLVVGGEWFLMWQSHTWNGQEAASRMFISVGIVTILLVLPDTDEQP